jgi:hypothetical protein
LKSTESTEDAELRNKGHIFFRAFRVFRDYGFLIGLFRAALAGSAYRTSSGFNVNI